MMGDESNFGQGDSSLFFFLKDWYDTIVPHAFPADQKRAGTGKDFQKPAESNRKMISRSLEDHHENFPIFLNCVMICLG
jgi:hypothetical protein